MTVHPLQARNHQPIRNRRNAERVICDEHCPRPPEKVRCDGFLLSRLAKPAEMNFNRFRKAGDHEIPLGCQSIAPATFRDAGIEAAAHQIRDPFRRYLREKIEIAPDVGPVVKRLDDNQLVGMFLEGITNLMQKPYGCADPGSFRRKRALSPSDAGAITRIASQGEKGFHSAHKHVIRPRKGKQVLELRTIKALDFARELCRFSGRGLQVAWREQQSRKKRHGRACEGFCRINHSGPFQISVYFVAMVLSLLPEDWLMNDRWVVPVDSIATRRRVEPARSVRFGAGAAGYKRRARLPLCRCCRCSRARGSAPVPIVV